MFINLGSLIMLYHPGFEALREVARQGSFIKAARALGVSGPAVSKQIKNLEARLNMVLLHRTTRAVTLTEAGQSLTEILNRSGGEVESLLEQLSLGQDRPFGRLKMNVPMSFGEMFLHKPIADYAATYPDVVIDVDFDDKRVHLVEEGYDLVVRIGVLEDSGLFARRVGDCPIYLCATPDFLERHGTPQTPDALSALPAVIYSNDPAGSMLTYRDADGANGSVPLRPHFYANSAGMMREACLRGVGIALLPAFCCESHLQSGTLIRLLPAFDTSPDRGIYVVYPDRRFLPLKVRAFIDILESRLGKTTS